MCVSLINSLTLSLGLIKAISNNAHQHIYTRAHEEAPKDETQKGEKEDKPKQEKKVKMSKAEKRAEAEAAEADK